VSTLFVKEPGLGQKAVAEALGTFLLTFIGAGAIIATQYLSSPSQSYPGLIVVALGTGLALAIAVSATMNTSGGHINPAVTLGMLVTKRISLRNALIYIVAQIAGAVIAGYLLFAVYPSATGSAVNWGAPSLGGNTSVAQGILLEAVMTFFLLFAVFGTAVDPKAPKIGGFGIGLTVAIDIMAGGPFTGAEMNPAKAIGPEIASLYFQDWYVYWIGPIVGGIIAALLYEYVILRHQQMK
jgi:MIP family channel proteins